MSLVKKKQTEVHGYYVKIIFMKITYQMNSITYLICHHLKLLSIN